jgi:PRTRC genetic system protein E
MFKELHPLIQNRCLTITVAAMGGGRIRVNVVPQTTESDNKINDKIGYSHQDKVAKVPASAITGLTTPLSLTGSPEEIDAELPGALTEFADSHVRLQKTLEAAKEQIAAAIKQIQEREKNKSKTTAARAEKVEEKNEKPGSSGELLPLWCKPSTGTGAIASETSSATPSANTTPPSQSAINSEEEEVVT